MKTKVIVFSSKEGYKLAQAIQRNLYSSEYSFRLWTNNFFKLSSPTIHNFQSINSEYNFAIIVISADDCLLSREREVTVPRDNVVLEMGLCIGALGLQRTIIVTPEKVKLPSDLDGITVCRYQTDEDLEITASYIGSSFDSYSSAYMVANKIKNRISWADYSMLVNKLIDMIKKSVNFGGYYFDSIVSTSRRGFLIADLIARVYGRDIPIICLWADRRDGHGVYDSPFVDENNSNVIHILKSESVKNILVVDSALRSGVTMDRAKEYLRNKIGLEKTIKIAVLIADVSFKGKDCVDYVAEFREANGLEFFYNEFH